MRGEVGGEHPGGSDNEREQDIPDNTGECRINFSDQFNFGKVALMYAYAIRTSIPYLNS